MKPLVLVACVALAVPAVAQSGMTVTGTSRTSVRPDLCYLSLSPIALSPMPIESVEQKESVKKYHQAMTEGLRRFGLTVVGNTIPLTLTPHGEVRYGKTTATELYRFLESLHTPSTLTFDFSPALQERVQQRLLAQAVQDGLKRAKELGQVVGVSQLRLRGIQQHPFSPPAAFMQGWLFEDRPQTAPEKLASQSVSLQFAPLDVIIPTKK